MAQRIVVDPITRIEGHLRIEAELDAEQYHHASLFLRDNGTWHRDHPERTVIRGKPGRSPSAPAVFAPRCIHLHPSARWKMP